MENEVDDYDGEAESSVASLPNHIRQIGAYNVSSTETGVWIQHHYLPSNIWIDKRDFADIVEAVESLFN